LLDLPFQLLGALAQRVDLLVCLAQQRPLRVREAQARLQHLDLLVQLLLALAQPAQLGGPLTALLEVEAQAVELQLQLLDAGGAPPLLGQARDLGRERRGGGARLGEGRGLGAFEEGGEVPELQELKVAQAWEAVVGLEVARDLLRAAHKLAVGLGLAQRGALGVELARELERLGGRVVGALERDDRP
jgi:hypothetical protein